MPANKRDSHFLPWAASGRLCKSDPHVRFTTSLNKSFDQSPPRRPDQLCCKRYTPVPPITPSTLDIAIRH